MCDIYWRGCHGGHRIVSMHHSDFVLPRDVVLAVYCPECEKAEKALMYHEGDWAIRYSMRVLASRIWMEQEIAAHRGSLESMWESFADHPCRWGVPGGEPVVMSYREKYGWFRGYERANRFWLLWRLDGLLELDRAIEAARKELWKRWDLAQLLGKGWAAFNGDPNEMSEVCE